MKTFAYKKTTQGDQFRLIDNNFIVHNNLINYLNFIKEPMQKQLLTGVL